MHLKRQSFSRLDMNEGLWLDGVKWREVPLWEILQFSKIPPRGLPVGDELPSLFGMDMRILKRRAGCLLCFKRRMAIGFRQQWTMLQMFKIRFSICGALYSRVRILGSGFGVWTEERDRRNQRKGERQWSHTQKIRKQWKKCAMTFRVKKFPQPYLNFTNYTCAMLHTWCLWQEKANTETNLELSLQWARTEPVEESFQSQQGCDWFRAGRSSLLFSSSWSTWFLKEKKARAQ